MIRRLLIAALMAAALSGCTYPPVYLVSTVHTPTCTTYVYESETGKLTTMRYDIDGRFIGSTLP